jgi:hypothetical protein
MPVRLGSGPVKSLLDKNLKNCNQATLFNIRKIPTRDIEY